MPNLVIRHRVPVADATNQDDSFLYFETLPRGLEQGLSVVRDQLKVHLWLDDQCVQPYRSQTLEKHLQSRNIRVSHLLVDVEVPSVTTTLASFVLEQGRSNNPQKALESSDSAAISLAQQHGDLGRRVHMVLLESVNSLLRWVYAEKEQYWLTPHHVSADHVGFTAVRTGAQVTVDSGPAVPWQPPTIDAFHLTIRARAGVTLDDWGALRLLNSSARPTLARELISNARRLLEDGHHRAAVIEAVVALEVALNRFGARPDPGAFVAPVAERVRSGQSLVQDIEHLGLNASIRYLLPIALRPERFPPEVLARSGAALDVRNNLVHRGSRLDDKKAEEAILASLGLARLLVAATLAKEDGGPLIASTPPTSGQSA